MRGNVFTESAQILLNLLAVDDVRVNIITVQIMIDCALNVTCQRPSEIDKALQRARARARCLEFAPDKLHNKVTERRLAHVYSLGIQRERTLMEKTRSQLGALADNSYARGHRGRRRGGLEE